MAATMNCHALHVATTTTEKMIAVVMVRWKRGRSDIKVNDGTMRTAT